MSASSTFTRLAMAAILGTMVSGCAAAESEKVPFASCASDGQMGPKPALEQPGQVSVPNSPAGAQLTFYQARETPAVLGPRGWHCAGLYGSNGATLVLTPERHAPNEFMSGKFTLTGPAIQITLARGETSGRFEVAEIAARLFPEAAPFVRSIAAEEADMVGKKDFRFPAGPYPDDRLTYRGNFAVEYMTPAGRDGTGTRTFLKSGEFPISGVVLMDPGGDHDLVRLAVRLPPSLSSLAPFIVDDVKTRTQFRP